MMSADAHREGKIVLIGLSAILLITTAWWALALWPVQNGPAWLERTRYVCFGVAENGLPDAGGWIGLIGGPAGMLATLLIGWSAGVRELLARAHSSRRVALLLTVLPCVALLLLGGAAWRVLQARGVVFDATQPPLLNAADHPRLDTPAPALELVAQDGAQHTLAGRRGRPVVITFAFAHCETVCPLIVSHAVKAKQLLHGSTDDPVLMVITLDPWRDTPARLPAIARAWRLPPQDAWALSGDVATVEATLDAWQVPRQRDMQNGQITHPSIVYIIDRQGRIAFATTGGADIIARLVARL